MAARTARLTSTTTGLRPGPVSAFWPTARPIGSTRGWDPTLVLYDAAADELARDRDTNRRDALLDFTVPADGEYLIAIHDFLYDGGYQYFYRLSLSTGPYLDFVFPPAGLPGTNGPFTLYGRNLPGGLPADVRIDGKPLEKLVVGVPLSAEHALDLGWDELVDSVESGLDAIEYRLDSPAGPSNPVHIALAGAGDRRRAAGEQRAGSCPADRTSLRVCGPVLSAWRSGLGYVHRPQGRDLLDGNLLPATGTADRSGFARAAS